MTKAYPTELMTPFEPMRRPPLSADAKEFMTDEMRKREKERRSKFDLLLDHYGILQNDPQMQEKLLWELINAHVPGFSVRDLSKRRQGQPRKTVSERLQLISDVVRLRLDSDRSVISACRELVETEGYSDFTALSLQKRYDEARKMPVAQVLMSLGLDESRPDLWEAFSEAYRESPEIEEFNSNAEALPDNGKL